MAPGDVVAAVDVADVGTCKDQVAAVAQKTQPVAPVDPLPGCQFQAQHGTYVIQERLGSGGYATVYKCISKDGTTALAIKLGNSAISQQEIADELLEECWASQEMRMYKKLGYGRKDSNLNGIPRVYEAGLITVKPGEARPFLLMQLLGPSLHKLTNKKWRDYLGIQMTLVNFIQIGVGMLSALQYMHERALVHRDIKPGNFCLGEDYKKLDIFIVDMGFTQPAPKLTDKQKDEFVGTPDYASTRALMGFRQGPSDDLESLGYALLELWLGNLPWSLTTNSEAASGWTTARLKEMATQRAQKWIELCEAGTIPNFLIAWHSHVVALNTTDKPSYSWLSCILNSAGRKSTGKRRRESLEDENSELYLQAEE